MNHNHRLTKKQERIALWVLAAIILLMLCIAGTGCTTIPQQSYVTWQTYKTAEEVKRVCGQENAACAQYNLEKKTCTIHTTLPVSAWILGHETCHCFKGQYHAQHTPAGIKFSGAIRQTFDMCGL